MTVIAVSTSQTTCWLSTTAQAIKTVVGDQLWGEIVKAVGGSFVYIPMEFSYYENRNRRIVSFAKTHTIRQTATRFCLSPRRVKQILGKVR